MIAAPEIWAREAVGYPAQTEVEIKASLHVCRLIEQHCPVYLSNNVMVRMEQPHLTAFKLRYGYKRFLGINSYDYYLRLRFALGKKAVAGG